MQNQQTSGHLIWGQIVLYLLFFAKFRQAKKIKTRVYSSYNQQKTKTNQLSLEKKKETIPVQNQQRKKQTETEMSCIYSHICSCRRICADTVLT